MREIAALLLLASCASAPKQPNLSLQAKAVKVLTSSDACADCEYIGPVQAYYGGNFKTFETNLELATNDVRNQTARKGGTHVVITSTENSKSRGLIAGENCPNCVTIIGQIYKCADK